MANLEIKVEKLDERVTSLERQVSNTMIKVDMLVAEMRDRDNQRAKEIMEMRQKHDADMKELQKNFYTKMDNLDSKIDGIGNHVRNLAITSMAAVGGMFIAVGAMVATVTYFYFKKLRRSFYGKEER